jgi:CRP/FNR family cyclic AMP-dependent transcriptional regulator
MTPIHLLKNIPLFAALKEEEYEQLAAVLRRQSVERGHILFHRGDEGAAMYLIQRGKIKISLPTRMGDEITLATLTEGEFFGEMALLDEQPRSATATALEDSQLYILRQKDFFDFVIRHENAIRSILAVLSMRLRKTGDLLAEMCFLTVPNRLAKRLWEMTVQKVGKGTAELTITQKDLAQMLGTTRETINKELKTLRDKGIVSTSRNKVVILDTEALRRRLRN